VFAGGEALDLGHGIGREAMGAVADLLKPFDSGLFARPSPVAARVKIFEAGCLGIH
jgi:hypothetical protein